jgi:plastocyanin
MQYVKSRTPAACVTACTLLLALCSAAATAELSVTVQQPDSQGFEAAVVVAEPARPVAPARTAARATMVQKDLMFMPDILVVRTGTAVDFPNNDPVRHQVYSFSGAKKFQLSLYSGSQHAPVVFDQAGVVTLGCNIHDGMIGYIYVTNSPWFGRTGRDGRVSLGDLPAGDYQVHVWHPRIKDDAGSLTKSVSVNTTGTVQLSFKLAKSVSPANHMHGTAKQWEDY